jgi:adenine C2-methylase RlmN of 23S rRNA A2503 and tRNA A37
MEWNTRYSRQDASVNFVAKTEDGGAFEARFVQRDPSYFIAYLSSQSGCNQACRFCHLTQLRQTMMEQATIAAYHEQFEKVLEHYDTMCMPVDRFNVNMMARGEPLLNPHFVQDFGKFVAPIAAAARGRGIDYRINISSIFPRETSGVDLVRSFKGYPVTFYWSLYSLRPDFRRRWLPKASDPKETLARLLDWQKKTGREVVIHHALIKGQNDRLCDHLSIRDFIGNSGLNARLNLVRYNTFGAKTGEEASDEAYTRALDVIGDGMSIRGSRIVPRVGRDVAASCGTFLV